MANPQRPPPFPSANTPRTWLITAAASPIGLTLARSLLDHGDKLILGVLPQELDPRSGSPTAEELSQFVEDAKGQGWGEKFKIVGLDGRAIGQCQAAVAEAVGTYGGLDILFCCATETVIGAVEELGSTERSWTLVREQMETNFFGPTNVIKAALPAMRERRTGHIMVLTGITSHLGTPGLGIYCAAGWALEGLCDSLAYEIAPYNIKLTIVQPNIEISVLPNKISAAPQLAQYANPPHPAPLQRAILGRVLDRLGVTAPTSLPARPQPPRHKSSDSTQPPSSSSSSNSTATEQRSKILPPPLGPTPESPTVSDPLPSLSTSQPVSIYPSLSHKFLKPLLAETVYALCAIGGHENPPARHIVGNEAVSSVKEKLKTVSEELEDFIECSSNVDIDDKGIGKGGKEAKKESEEREREVGASTSQNSLVSGPSASGAEEGGKASGKVGSMGRRRSDGSLPGSSSGAKRGSVGAASIAEEMDLDGPAEEGSRERKRKGKGRKKSTGS